MGEMKTMNFTYRDFTNLVPFGIIACVSTEVGGSIVVSLSLSSRINLLALSLSNANKSKINFF
jgi:hypothetical protein